MAIYQIFKLSFFQSKMHRYFSQGLSCLSHRHNLRFDFLYFCIFSLAHENTPYVGLFSYIGGTFVYCPFLLDLFTDVLPSFCIGGN